MQITKRKEDISISYISALCAHAGIAYEITRHDADSTDGILKKTITLDGQRKYNAELRIQLKCTSSVSQYAEKDDAITYKLKVKNYNDLCLPATSPMWLSWSREELLLKGCMYWAKFSGEQESSNIGTVSVRIEKKNVLNTEMLLFILEKVAREEWP